MFKFKEGAKQEIGSEDVWYALTDGGYLKPEVVIDDEKQLQELQEAIKLVRSFIQQCYDDEVIEEC